MEIYYTVYKTTNLINNCYYVGVHKTTNLNDSYLGSGKLIKQAFRKYGKINFKKEILFIFTSLEEAYQKEKEIVDENFINESLTYNLVVGGIPTTDFYPNRTYLSGENHWSWGKKNSEESNKRRSEKLLGGKMSLESSIKKSESLKGKLSPLKGRTLSIDDRKAKSISALNLKKLKCPYCGKLTDPGNSKQWHFENCKSKIDL